MSSIEDGRHDFDFYFGRWQVHNERLKERMAGSHDWETFPATQECRPILDGLGNIDDFVTDAFGATRFVGMSLRLFDPVTRRWSIYWSSNRTGRLEAPVVGSFTDGVGTFEGADMHAGIPVTARFVWSHIRADSARWEQSLSLDGGRTWEPNWRMRMTRVHT